MRGKPRPQQFVTLLIIFATAVALHAPLLSLPYFWDESGYYIPAARDLLLLGSLVPVSAASAGHPPLSSAYLALAWKLFGYSPLVARCAMLLVAAFALLQVYRLAREITNTQVAIASAICFGPYPVFFAQSTLTHADLLATALTLWGLSEYFAGSRSCGEPAVPVKDRSWTAVLAFSLAALAKEIAIVTPLAIAMWGLLGLMVRRWNLRTAGRPAHKELLPSLWWDQTSSAEVSKTLRLLLPAAPLALWFVYHHQRTGYFFGSPYFFQYNVSATLNPLRFLLAAIQRIWQAFGYMNLWILTAMTGAAMLLPPLRDRDTATSRDQSNALPTENKGSRPRISVPVQLTFLAIIVANIIFHSIVGGAELARYMMPVVALVIIIGVSTLYRRVRQWKLVVAFVCLTFVIAWFVNPPVRFSPEDNLNYSDYVRLHQQATNYLSARYPQSRILTAWPASDELTHPYLGYTAQPLRVVRIENFTFAQIMLAQQNADYDAALIFSTKYEPPRRWFRWKFWEDANVRFFDYHEDLRPDVVARLLGGTIVMEQSRNGQWVAVLEFPRIRNARLTHLK